MATEAPPAVEVKTTETTTQAIIDPAANTAAAPEARFQNVDLEAGAATGNVGTTEPAKPTEPAAPSKITEIADMLDWGTANLLLAFCAIIVMISSATICGGGVELAPGFPVPAVPCNGMAAYQVACGTISAFFALLAFIGFRAGAISEPRMMEGISAFQFLWWLTGMIVLTFFGSYQSVQYANGYFGTWAAFFFAAVSLIIVSTAFRGTVDSATNNLRSPLVFLMIASAVVMGAAIGPCSPSSACVSYHAWALSMGTISLAFTIILLLGAGKIPSMVHRVMGFFFVVWWGIGFLVVSFGGPFVTPGNGYFASLGAVFASVAFLKLALSHA